MVDPSVVFVDSTHVKARANGKKYHDELAQEQALWYAGELLEEIQRNREAHGKRPLTNLTSPNDEEDKEEATEEDDHSDGEPPTPGILNKNTSKKKRQRRKEEQHKKVGNSDPGSGWFHKGEHKHAFAYSVQAACDRHGVILISMT